MSIGIAIFILINAFKNLKDILDLFLEKTPKDISVEEIKKHLLDIKEIEDVHHIHIWSMDGFSNYLTMHIVTENKNIKELKNKIRKEMSELGISHTTIEIENKNDNCEEKECEIKINNEGIHHHHHH